MAIVSLLEFVTWTVVFEDDAVAFSCHPTLRAQPPGYYTAVVPPLKPRATPLPGTLTNALAQAARAWLPMVQVPPRGVWRRSGQARQAPLDSWLGGPLFAIPLEQLVSRYLTAFGPATVRDVQTWSGLTRLAEVLDRLRPRLQVFTDPDGAELFDLPDAPRPDADTPAPVRFLYDFDNLLLGHADRRRVLGDLGGADYATHGYGPTSQRQPASVLVDGTVACTWTMDTTPGAATLTIRPFRALNPSEHADVRNEGTALLAFLHPDRTPHVHQE